MISRLLGGKDLAIDMGTSNTVIYVAESGLALREASVVVVGAGRDGGKTVLAVGEEARRMVGRTSGAVRAIRPMQAGVIADPEAASALVRRLVAKAVGRRPGATRRVLVGAPLGATSVERQAFAKTVRGFGGSRAAVMDGPLAAAMGAGLPVAEPVASMIVDIGGGVTETAVISLGGVVVSASLRCGGDDFDEAIQRRVRGRYQMAVSLAECERAKMALGLICPAPRAASAEVRGRDLVSGLPRALRVTAEDVHDALAEHVRNISESVRGVLERCPPELAGDLADGGVTLTGGGALLHGVVRFLAESLRLPVRLTEDPLSCVACGLGRSLEAGGRERRAP